MSNNPFEALGGPGGFDLNALMQQAQQMQASLQDAQARLADTTVDGVVAGGLVTVKVSGVGDLTAIEIKPEALAGTDAESLADLADLIIAAYRDGRTKAEALAEQAMGPLTGGLPGMPGGAPGQLGF
jgi:hypothetical protein